MTLKYNKNLNIFVFQDSQLQIEQEKKKKDCKGGESCISRGQHFFLAKDKFSIKKNKMLMRALPGPCPRGNFLSLLK